MVIIHAQQLLLPHSKYKPRIDKRILACLLKYTQEKTFTHTAKLFKESKQQWYLFCFISGMQVNQGLTMEPGYNVQEEW